MTYKEAVKVTFVCNYDFGHYPFDYHECEFNYGIPGQSYNGSLFFTHIHILNGSNPVLLSNEKYIPSELPYSFSITGKNTFPKEVYGYFAPFS